MQNSNLAGKHTQRDASLSKPRLPSADVTTIVLIQIIDNRPVRKGGGSGGYEDPPNRGVARNLIWVGIYGSRRGNNHTFTVH